CGSVRPALPLVLQEPLGSGWSFSGRQIPTFARRFKLLGGDWPRAGQRILQIGRRCSESAPNIPRGGSHCEKPIGTGNEAVPVIAERGPNLVHQGALVLAGNYTGG